MKKLAIIIGSLLILGIIIKFTFFPAAEPVSISYGDLTISASSEFKGGFGQGPKLASMAFDQDTSSKWSAMSMKFPQWIQVDLGKSTKLSEVDIYWDKSDNPDNPGYYSYEILAGNHPDSLKTVYDGSSNKQALLTRNELKQNNARYVKVNILGTTATTSFKAFKNIPVIAIREIVLK